MKRLAAGEAAAARTLARRHTPRVLALAHRLLGGDAAEAEDVAQEAMLRLWRIAPDWRAGEARISTWLYRVAANLCADRLRRRHRIGPALDDIAEPPDTAPAAEARLAALDQARAVKAGLAALPDRQRLAIVLRHFEGLANPEIGAALGVSVEAVESLLARGRRGLRETLTKSEGGHA